MAFKSFRHYIVFNLFGVVKISTLVLCSVETPQNIKRLCCLLLKILLNMFMFAGGALLFS